VPAASAPVVGSVRIEITKKQSMVGDGRKLPNATRPLSPGRASKTLAAARPTKCAGVTCCPVVSRTRSMYSNSRVASISAVAQIIGSFRGRQVAMAILRQVENGIADIGLNTDESFPGYAL